MDTYKVTLTVIEPVEVIGFFEAEDEEDVVAQLTPKLFERWGEGNVTITDISIADEEEKAFVAEAIVERKKEMN